MYIKMRFLKGVSKALTLSYDDGATADERFIGIMRKNGLRGTFNLNSSMFLYGNDEKEKERVERQMIHEILDDRERLEKEFTTIIRGMAYPYGSYDDNVLQALKLCGICYSRTVGATGGFGIPQNWLELEATCHHEDSRLWDLTDEFINAKDKADPMLFYVWGHSHEFDRRNNWDRFEQFAEKTGNRDDVWYATNIEIYDYVQGFNRLQMSADCKIIHNPNAFTVWFWAYGKNYSIAPGETKRI